MIVNAVPNADPPHALVEGLQSGRALSILIRAVIYWYAFGPYDYVMADLSGFGDWSSPVADELATVASGAADAGHWLALFPIAARWMRAADDGRLHVFPDRAHAQRAMQQRWLAQARVGAARRPVALTPGSWRGLTPGSWRPAGRGLHV
jgi:hypothetical protein